LNLIDAPGGAKIPALSAADLLATLDERELTAGIESVSAWLRHLVILTPKLEPAPRGSGSPWLDEQAMRLARQETEIHAVSRTDDRDYAESAFRCDVLAPTQKGVRYGVDSLPR
jgi:hypothetical protein